MLGVAADDFHLASNDIEVFTQEEIAAVQSAGCLLRKIGCVHPYRSRKYVLHRIHGEFGPSLCGK